MSDPLLIEFQGSVRQWSTAVIRRRAECSTQRRLAFLTGLFT